MREPGCDNLHQSAPMTRREVLRAGSLGLVGLSLSDMLRGRDAFTQAAPVTAKTFGKAKACIMLFMWGGPAQQDTWDLKPDAPQAYRGEFKPIPTAVPGTHICEHLPKLAKRTDKLCIVRSMTHDNVDHTAATHYMLTGEPPLLGEKDKRKYWPNLGSTLSALKRGRGALPATIAMRPKLDNTVPRFVEQSQGMYAGWLGQVHDPFIIDHDPSKPGYKIGEMTLHPELSVRRVGQRRGLLDGLDKRLNEANAAFEAQDANNQRAFELLTAAATQRGAFNLDEEPMVMRRRYGMNPHGQSVLQARRLVERGVPLVTVYWPNDGIKNVSVYWDTHSRNFIDLKERLMPTTDQAFSALLDDLSERNMLDETLVVWTGEFGRTPKVGQRNSDAGAGRDGRDHWPGVFTTVLAGGGARGGLVYGSSDKHAAYPDDKPVKPRDLIATVYHALGVPEQQIVHDITGRPQFVRPGNAVEALLG